MFQTIAFTITVECGSLSFDTRLLSDSGESMTLNEFIAMTSIQKYVITNKLYISR